MLNTSKIKKDFPVFRYHPKLVYLDSTATSLKPDIVVKKVQEYYEQYPANVHRGIYELSEKASREYEETRQIVADFINSTSQEEIIFTRNTSESINLVAYALGRKILSKGDEIVTSVMEHHSNFVPWQQLATENEIKLKIIDVTEEGELDILLKSFDTVITKHTKILALTYVSNVLAVINPIKNIIKAARKINPGIIVVIDAAQAAPHLKLDVKDLDCDFLAFSSHKMLGPTGIGVLWGRKALLDEMYPFEYGGDMISEVYLDHTVFKAPPHKFEAGTPHIDGVISLKEAIRYLNKIGMERIKIHEEELGKLAIHRMREEFGNEIKILGETVKNRCGLVSFRFNTIHPHDVAQVLDENHIAVRAGNHCAMPLHTRYGLNATCRASFYIYNGRQDVELLIEALKKTKKLLG